MSSRDPVKPTLDDNPGLEHDRATEEGELMTAAGSSISDPRGANGQVTLDDNPGLEHDEATEAGQLMSAEGSRSWELDGDASEGTAESHG